MLYKVEGAKQVFIKNTQIETEGNTGVFKFNLPKDTKIGSYRITYDLKSDGFIDFLFNKDIILSEMNLTKEELSAELDRRYQIAQKDFELEGWARRVINVMDNSR